MRKAMLLLAVFGLASLLFIMPLSAVAQTKASGTGECGKPDPTYTIQVPGENGFTYVIGEYKCTWPKSFTVEGLQSTQNVFVEFDEVTGDLSRSISSGYTQFNNGDKAYWRYIGTSDTKTMLASGTWTYTRGTGKLLGIKGSGTTTCKLKPAGAGSICEIKGEYTLPPAKK